MLESSITIDVEDWFHILDCPSSPKMESWPTLERRFDIGLERILQVLDKFQIKATLFWLGWLAERHPELVERCKNEGHEIASHGYDHVLAYKVGRKWFAEDIRRGKKTLEDIIGCEVKGFRAAGFSVKNNTQWVFNEIRAAGFSYDSSTFPCNRGHGGMSNGLIEPHVLNTSAGELVEIPQSVIEIFGKRMSFFGGGYLRLSPKALIEWGIRRLDKAGRPLIVYVHPREVDADHPRLQLPLFRRFKCYVNLKTTLPKLKWLCENHSYVTMAEIAKQYYSVQSQTSP